MGFLKFIFLVVPSLGGIIAANASGGIAAGLHYQYGPVGAFLFGFIFVAILLAIYLLPTIVAVFRRHHNWPAVAAFNIFFGWTVAGWGVTLVSALLAPPVVLLPVQVPPVPQQQRSEPEAIDLSYDRRTGTYGRRPGPWG
jgi:hypothetical protein